MNLSLLKDQILRNVVSARCGVIVAMSVALGFVQYWTTYHSGMVLPPSAPTFLHDTMLFSRDGTGSGLYLFLLPFLAALLGGSVVAAERHSGRMKELLAREGRSRVLGTSLVSGFVLGGIGGLLPLLLNIIVAAALNPHLSFIDGDIVGADGEVPNQYVLIDSSSWAYPLYKFNQPLLILVVVLMVFVISGLFADVAVASSFFTGRKYVEILIPFVISTLWWMLPTLTNLIVPDQWSHIIFLSVAGGASPELVSRNYVGMALSVVLPTVACLVMFLIERRRDAI